MLLFNNIASNILLSCALFIRGCEREDRFKHETSFYLFLSVSFSCQKSPWPANCINVNTQGIEPGGEIYSKFEGKR